MTPRVSVLKPSPLQKPPGDEEQRPVDITDPVPLKNAISGGLERDVFTLVDSRSGVWRYYLLLGPRSGQWTNIGLGRRLVTIAKASKGGIGRNILLRYDGRVGKVPRAQLEALGKRLKTVYRVATDFWLKAKSDPAYGVLVKASARVRRGEDGRDEAFFDEGADGPDGWARRAFHRVLTDAQSAEAKKLARLLRGSGWDVFALLYKVDFESISKGAGKLLLTLALTRALFRKEEEPLSEEDSEEMGAVSADDWVDPRVVRAAIRGLRADLGTGLDDRTRERLIHLLREALKRCNRGREAYVPPLLPPPLLPDKSRQRVFADVRLSTFARILAATA